jgi:hypothetical protein
MRVPGWLGPLLLAVFGAGLAAWSWEKWADPHIDFGAELYTAWRLSEGDALYRDIAYRHGPLPHYLNALWFTLFGVSIRTLALCNLAVLAGIAALGWDIFRRALGAWVATATTAVLLGVFAFGQYVPIANYNFVTPYHHHQTHGLALSLAMIAAFAAAWRHSGPAGLRWSGLAGLCLGGVFLTKLELFVPAAAAAALGLMLPRGRDRGPRAVAFAAGCTALPLVFFVLLAARMPASLALTGLLGNWAHLGGGLLADPFYRHGAGLDHPLANLGAAAGAFLVIALLAAALLGLDRLLPAGRARLPLALGAGASLFALLVAGPLQVPWPRGARALPLTSAAAAALLLVRLWPRRGEREYLARWGPLALYAVLALGLLGKMLLNARIEQYGFALAMPATLLLVASLFALADRAPGRGGGVLARALLAGAVAAGVVSCLARSDAFYRRKDFALGQGGDRILAVSPYTSPRARLLAETLARLERLLTDDSTLVVMPEGASLNYWLRKRNPSGYLLFLPTEIAAFGEQAMLARLRAHPPDFVVLVHRLWQEFGTGPFGEDPRNGRALMDWVDRHYERVAGLGSPPFGDHGFGVVILRRERAPAPDSAAGPPAGGDSVP